MVASINEHNNSIRPLNEPGIDLAQRIVRASVYEQSKDQSLALAGDQPMEMASRSRGANRLMLP
jgi:hypothetical protein